MHDYLLEPHPKLTLPKKHPIHTPLPWSYSLNNQALRIQKIAKVAKTILVVGS